MSVPVRHSPKSAPARAVSTTRADIIHHRRRNPFPAGPEPAASSSAHPFEVPDRNEAGDAFLGKLFFPHRATLDQRVIGCIGEGAIIAQSPRPRNFRGTITR